jgi:hypothetical protein
MHPRRAWTCSVFSAGLTKLIHRRPPKKGDGFCRRFAFSPSLDRTADGSGAAMERLEIGTNRNANSWFLK